MALAAPPCGGLDKPLKVVRVLVWQHPAALLDGIVWVDPHEPAPRFASLVDETHPKLAASSAREAPVSGLRKMRRFTKPTASGYRHNW